MKRQQSEHLTLVAILVFLFSHIAAAQEKDSSAVKMKTSPDSLINEDQIQIEINDIRNEIGVLDSSLALHTEQHSLDESNPIFQHPIFVALLSAGVTAILSLFVAVRVYKRQEYEREKQRQNTCWVLQNTLFDEAEEIVFRCCYLVECNAVVRISRASFHQSARYHLMDSFSKLSDDASVLTAFTKIYNCFDRIKRYQDETIEFDTKNDPRMARKTQGIAVSFIRDYLNEMIENLKKINHPIKDSLLKRVKLINISPNDHHHLADNAYSTLAYIHSLHDDNFFGSMSNSVGSQI